MERSFEAVLVEQCATTLAGVKPASLFRYQGADKRQPREAAARWAKELAPYGITIRVLKYCPQTGACLIYLYRAGWLRSILSEPSTRAFLAGQGYGADQSCQELLRQLSRRLCLEREFPHEIGVFLGYPPGGCGGLHPEPGQELHLLRILEGLRRPGGGTKAFRSIPPLHCRLL